MTQKALHIVTFDNPYPANYGGAIDVYYKIKALHQAGVHIFLHCFLDKRQQTKELHAICDEVYIYAKRSKISALCSHLPLAVALRRNKELLENLSINDAPILFEGLQTTWPLLQNTFKNRKLYVRAHNVEHDYYLGLAASSTRVFKKIILKYEARKLKNYEKILANVDTIFALSRFDFQYFRGVAQGVAYLPVFHGNKQTSQLSPRGKYVLYHGDLSIVDNLRTAQFLIEVFRQLPYPLIISGNKNLNTLASAVEGYAHIQLKPIDSDEAFLDLFKNAHINICWSFQRSGTKLKVINSLYMGRHCVINENVVDEKTIEALCTKVNDKEGLKGAIEKLMNRPYDQAATRQNILDRVYNVESNAEKLIRAIFD